jgi:hypothetical protein
MTVALHVLLGIGLALGCLTIMVRAFARFDHD